MSYDDRQKKRVSGALFERTAENGPAFSGFIEIEGVKTFISLWPNTSKAGNPYLGISEDLRAAEREAQKSRPVQHWSNRGPRTFQPRSNPNITTGPQRQQRPPFDDGIPDFDFDEK